VVEAVVLLPAIASITAWVGRVFAVLIVLCKGWTPEQTAQVLRALGTVIGTRNALPLASRGDADK
jgi:hypothetical protein